MKFRITQYQYIVPKAKQMCEKFGFFNVLKVSCVIFIAAAVASHNALGSSRDVGNGGVIVVCKSTVAAFESTRLLDFYEGSLIFNLPVSEELKGLKFEEIMAMVLGKIAEKDPRKAEKYQNWYQNFEKDFAFLKNMVLTRTNDEVNIALEVGCELAQAALQRKPLFPEEKRVYVSQDLWSLLSAEDKAGLVLHEIVYREAIEKGQVTSRNTRLFVAYIFSDTINNETQESYMGRIKNLGLITE